MVDPYPEQDLDRIIDFSLGLLAEEQEQALLAAARHDSQLEVMMRKQCALREICQSAGVTSALAQDCPPAPRNRVTRMPTFNLVIFGALLAASLALVLLVKPAVRTETLWLPVDDILTIQRSAEGGVSALREGVDLYARHDLVGAVSALEGAQVQGAVGDLRDLFLASAQFNLGRPAEAGVILGRMNLASLPHPWREYGEKMQLLCERPATSSR